MPQISTIIPKTLHQLTEPHNSILQAIQKNVNGNI